MADIRAHSSKHEVTVIFLEPTEFEIIASDAKAWKQLIVELNGPTTVFCLFVHMEIYL